MCQELYTPSKALSDAADEFALDIDSKDQASVEDFIHVALLAHRAYVDVNIDTLKLDLIDLMSRSTIATEH